MKFTDTCPVDALDGSLPVRGAWIEMFPWAQPRNSSRPSLPVRGAWIEIAGAKGTHRYREGRSPCGERGLKYFADGQLVDALVAPRAGSVD